MNEQGHGGTPVAPKVMEVSDEGEVRRRWRTLDEAQRGLAEELVERALELRELSDGELGIREALELATGAVRRRRLAATWTAAAIPATESSNQT